MTEPATFPNPLQIQLGLGKLTIQPAWDDEGHGVLISAVDPPGVVGELYNPEAPDEARELVPGEILIHSVNVEGLKVLREMVDRAIDAFESDEDEPEIDDAGQLL